MSSDDYIDEVPTAYDTAPAVPSRRAPQRWRGWIIAACVVGALLIAATIMIVGGPATPSAYRLDANSQVTSADRKIHAGNAVELCVPARDDGTAIVGLSVRNPGSKEVTVTQVTTGLDRYTDVSSNGYDSAGVPISLPVRIAAHSRAQIDVVVRSPQKPIGDSEAIRSRIFIDSVDVQFRVDGVVHEQTLKLRRDGLLFIALDDAQPGQHACDGTV